MTLLQISAPINPGNSGGGLFNLAGELVGVVNAKMSSTGIEGLGFAIPIDTAYEIILELIEHGYVRGRPTLDFNVIDMNASSAYQLFGVYMAGVYVYDDDHPVMMYGDLIISADGQEVSSVSVLESLLRKKQVGDTLELTVYRDRKSITVTVTIAENRPQT
jgi:serine protease Do